MKVGLLGVGRIGAHHAGVLARDPALDKILVGDANPTRAAEARERGLERERRRPKRRGDPARPASVCRGSRVDRAASMCSPRGRGPA